MFASSYSLLLPPTGTKGTAYLLLIRDGLFPQDHFLKENKVVL